MPDERVFGEWLEDHRCRSGKLVVYKLSSPKDSKAPRLTLSQTPDYMWHLTAEVSLAAWARGSNASLSNTEEIHHGFGKLTDFTQSMIDLPFDAANSRVSRVDFAEDRIIGVENIRRIIRNLSDVEATGFNTKLIPGESVYLENRGRSKSFLIKAYDKQRQLKAVGAPKEHIDACHGILRFEVVHRSNRIDTVVRQLSLPTDRPRYF